MPQGGVHQLIVRCMVPDDQPEWMGVRESFYFAVHGEQQHLRDHSAQARGAWQWVLGNSPEAEASPFRVRLARGEHTVVIGSCAPLTRLDRIVLTTSPYAEAPQR